MRRMISIGVLSLLSVAVRAEECRPLVVFQVSEAALNRNLDVPVSRLSAIDDTILETRVVGTAHTTGSSRVTLVDNDDGAMFKIVFEGKTSARTQGHHPPIVIHSHSQTAFRAEKIIIVEQLGQSREEPTTIAARTQTTIDNITTDRRGPVGRLILRRAAREVAARQGTASAIGQRNAERRIVAAFDNALAGRLEQLEKQVAMRGLVATLLPSDSSPVYRSSTKGGYVNMAVYAQSPAGQTVDLRLPKLPFDIQPIQVWVHQSVVAKNIDTALGSFGALRHIVPTLVAVPPPFPRFKGPQWTVVGDWFVIQLSGLDT